MRRGASSWTVEGCASSPSEAIGFSACVKQWMLHHYSRSMDRTVVSRQNGVSQMPTRETLKNTRIPVLSLSKSRGKTTLLSSVLHPISWTAHNIISNDRELYPSQHNICILSCHCRNESSSTPLTHTNSLLSYYAASYSRGPRPPDQRRPPPARPTTATRRGSYFWICHENHGRHRSPRPHRHYRPMLMMPMLLPSNC